VTTFDDFFPLKNNEIVTKYSFFKPFFWVKWKYEEFFDLKQKKKSNISATFYNCSFHEFEKLQ
jgi:hypothetical protein